MQYETDELTNLSFDTHDNGVATLELDRRRRLNAFDRRMVHDFHPVVEALEADPPDALVITGAGNRAFSIGMDPDGLAAENGPEEPQPLWQVVLQTQYLLTRIARLGTPIVAAVQGAAYGVGFETALVADIRIGGESTTVSFPEIEHGFVPAAGGTQRLPAIVGEGNAKEMLYTGDEYAATEVDDWGLFKDVVDDADVEDVAFELADDLAEKPRSAFAHIDRAVRASSSRTQTGFETELAGFNRHQSDIDYRTRLFEG